MRPPDSLSIFFAQGAMASEGMGAVGERNWCRRSVTVCWARAGPATALAPRAAAPRRARWRLREVMREILSKGVHGGAQGTPRGYPRHTPGRVPKRHETRHSASLTRPSPPGRATFSYADMG